MKRFIAILTASGALAAGGAALAPVAFADPTNGHANCTADVSTFFGPGFIGSVASSSAGVPGPNSVGLHSSTDCGDR